MTRPIQAVLAFAATISLSSIGQAAIKGDVNLDGQVDAADYALLNQALGGTYTLAWNQRDAADVAPIGVNDLIGDGAVTSADALVFDQALQGNDIDGDGLPVAAEIGGTAATNGSPFLRDTDRDGAPDDVDSTRGGFNANEPPSAPAITITGASGTSLSGTVSACSNPDSLPYPSACTQEVRVVAGGGSCDSTPIVAPVTPSGGAWTVAGLAAGVVYTAYARSSDGALVACSSAQTRATTPSGTAAVVPLLSPVSATTATNPMTVSGFAAPGQQIRVFVNGEEQDFVRSFATGNPAMPANPFIVAAGGAFSVPVVLDDGANRIAVSAISSGSVESSSSNEVQTKYENLIPRGTSNPLRILPQPTPDDPNSEEIAAGQIVVLTKGDMPGFTAEYYLDRHLEAKANALLVLGAGADLRFAGPTPYKRKLLVGGTLRTRGTATKLVRTYNTSPTTTLRDLWGGIEIQSTSRQSQLAGISVRNTGVGIAVLGTISSRPDLEVRDSVFAAYAPTAITSATGGQVTVTSSSFENSSSACDVTGIAMTGTTAVTLRENHVSSNRYAIRITDSSASIEENDLYSGICAQSLSAPHGAAIFVIGSGSTSIRRNDISHDSDESPGSLWWAGILVENASPLVEYNTLSSCVSAVEALTSGGGSASPTVQDNYFESIGLHGQGNNPAATNVYGGVVLRDGAGGIVLRNEFSNRTTPTKGRGVFVRNAGSAPISISDNEMTHLLMGVQVENTAIPSGESITVAGNSIGYIQRTGIRANFSDATISGNFIRSAGVSSLSDPWTSGISLASTTARIEQNSIHYSATYGIRAEGGSPEIIGNLLTRNTRAAILLKATAAGTLVQGNRIEDNPGTGAAGYGVGILVQNSGAGTPGTLVTIDGGNIITGNAVGIRIEGLGNSATGQPVPIIRANSIYANAYPVATGPIRNVEIVSYSTPSQTTLDLSSNWWNTTSQSEIQAAIVYVNPPGSGLQPIANIDFPNVVTAPNTNHFVGQLAAWLGATDARESYFSPNLAANPPPVASIKFVVYDAAASVRVRICPEVDASCSAANAVYTSAPQSFAAGARQIDWNGADSTGKLVAPEAYTYELEATKGAVTQVVEATAPDGFTGCQLLNPLGAPTSYDGYRNAPISVQCGVQSGAGNGGYAPGRAVFIVEPKNDAGEMIAGGRFAAGPENYPTGQPLPVLSYGSPSTPFLQWPSRHSESAQILSGDTQLSIVVLPMRRYVIVVAGSAPSITSDAGALNLTAEPRLVYDTFEQVAAISYKVDRLSDVTVSLLPPGSWSDTGAPAWQFTNVPANTPQLFQFRGHEVIGMVGVSAESARNLVTSLAQEGAFTFRVRATDKVSSRTAETVVTVQVRH